MAGSSPAIGAGEGARLLVKEVVKSYGPVRALKGVSLSVHSGEFVGITGPSGSGKSTLLNLIGTLDRPDSGEIVVDEDPVPEPRDAVEFRRRVVGFVFQDNLLLPYLTAQANIEAALLAAGVRHNERHERSAELLAEIGMEHRATHLPAQLSAGERQRVAIARALANRPRLLLADEPTGTLDSDSSERVLELLARLRERHGMTLVVVSHDPAVPRSANRVVQLIDGRIS